MTKENFIIHNSYYYRLPYTALPYYTYTYPYQYYNPYLYFDPNIYNYNADGSFEVLRLKKKKYSSKKD